jgi:hypothetical protein
MLQVDSKIIATPTTEEPLIISLPIKMFGALMTLIVIFIATVINGFKMF